MHQWKRNVVALGAAALVAACGGGGSDTTTKVNITSVKVMGDSLADVGTFGYKFTVQGADSLVFPQRVASSYGITSMCNYYRVTSATPTFGVNPAAGCTNYAIGGSRINFTADQTSKQSVIQQMADATASANIGASELVLIDGGGNDAADLVADYLAAAGDGGVAYTGRLASLLDGPTIAAGVAAGKPGLAQLGGKYMVALAAKFGAAIDANILAKGANYVAVLNMPGITNTPRFQMVLDSIAAANGGGTAGATARAQAEAVFKGWIEAFNGALAAYYAGNAKVAVVDFYTSFNEEVAIPAQYSLTNVKTPACPATGTGTDHLPTYTFQSCTDAALSNAPPTGVTDLNWWKTYAFSDGFHPTPYAHQLLGQLIARTLAAKGWL
ncbi:MULTISPECIES: SGNH/GDSL hydrolase family protein [unclassified Rhizobacter]|uniref:SGNH/GDSL hydrolase family protein n=1 Tax=unclassified Rhizobacter TaxID=2640088 RepID=UPI0006F5BF9E|nr:MULTISPECIES: SGNH/GDSL hydrolase family protein [unclassified Rhizobacter]KQU80700.1 phospholipase [Rhizobacter sp. Root29]KQW04244.1 phospholipase [Rhizobacter sp. Root1238]KRB14635.1 phospholipase [Rhizobacter sp. Root16D2]